MSRSVLSQSRLAWTVSVLLMSTGSALAQPSTPEFVYVVQHSWKESVGGTLSGLRTQQYIQRNSNGAVREYSTSIEASPTGFTNLSSGSYDGAVTCGGNSMTIRHHQQYSYDFGNALYIHHLDGDARVDVYACAPAGVSYEALLTQDVSIIRNVSRPGVVSTSGSNSSFGETSAGSTTVPLVTTSQAVSFQGRTYRYLGRVRSSVFTGGGRTCIIGCPRVTGQLDTTTDVSVTLRRVGDPVKRAYVLAGGLNSVQRLFAPLITGHVASRLTAEGYDVFVDLSATRRDVLDAAADPLARLIWVWAHGRRSASISVENGETVSANEVPFVRDCEPLRYFILNACRQERDEWREALNPNTIFRSWPWSFSFFNLRRFENSNPDYSFHPSPGASDHSFVQDPLLDDLAPVDPQEGIVVGFFPPSGHRRLTAAAMPPINNVRLSLYQSTPSGDVHLLSATVTDGYLQSPTPEAHPAPQILARATGDAWGAVLNDSRLFHDAVARGQIQLASAPGAGDPGEIIGQLFFRQSQPSTTELSTSNVSRRSGGMPRLQMDFTPAAAGGTFLVLVSVTDVAPGMDIPGAGNMPLTPDFVTVSSLASANTGLWAGNLGQLDANGRASWTLLFPSDAIPVDLVGRALYFCPLAAIGEQVFIGNYQALMIVE